MGKSFFAAIMPKVSVKIKSTDKSRDKIEKGLSTSFDSRKHGPLNALKVIGKQPFDVGGKLPVKGNIQTRPDGKRNIQTPFNINLPTLITDKARKNIPGNLNRREQKLVISKQKRIAAAASEKTRPKFNITAGANAISIAKSINKNPSAPSGTRAVGMAHTGVRSTNLQDRLTKIPPKIANSLHPQFENSRAASAMNFVPTSRDKTAVAVDANAVAATIPALSGDLPSKDSGMFVVAAAAAALFFVFRG